jgi:hypothetical protein
MKPAERFRVSIRMTTSAPTDPRTQTTRLPSAPSPAAPVEARGPAGLRALGQMDRRGWMALGVIGCVGAATGAAMGAGVHRTATFGAVGAALIAVSAARAAWGWLRGGSRRARLADGALAKIEAHGGGFYGTGAAITLLVLSARSMAGEWAAADGVWDFLRGMSLEFWIGFSGESIRNAVQAGLWPLHWYTNHGFTGVLGVAAAAWAGDAMADALRRRGTRAAENAEAPAAGSGSPEAMPM